MEVREVWRQAHLKQPLGSRDGSRTRQRGSSGLKSTTGGSRGGSSSIDRAGGPRAGGPNRRGNKGPHRRLHCLDDFEQSNNTAMLVPNTNTRARCTGDDESAPKTRDSTRRRCNAS